MLGCKAKFKFNFPAIGLKIFLTGFLEKITFKKVKESHRISIFWSVGTGSAVQWALCVHENAILKSQTSSTYSRIKIHPVPIRNQKEPIWQPVIKLFYTVVLKITSVCSNLIIKVHYITSCIKPYNIEGVPKGLLYLYPFSLQKLYSGLFINHVDIFLKPSPFVDQFTK